MLFVMVEDGGCILRSSIITLLIFCRRVMEGEEVLDEVLIWNNSVVETDVDYFNVGGVAGAYLSVWRIGDCSRVWTHEANAMTKDSSWVFLSEVLGIVLFRPPIASSTKSGKFFSLLIRFITYGNRYSWFLYDFKRVTIPLRYLLFHNIGMDLPYAIHY